MTALDDGVGATLHITFAEKTASIFKAQWPLVKDSFNEELTIPMETVALYGKSPNEGGGNSKNFLSHSKKQSALPTIVVSRAHFERSVTRPVALAF